MVKKEGARDDPLWLHGKNGLREDRHGPNVSMLSESGLPRQRQTGQGNIGIYSWKDQRCRCRQCRKTFVITQGTAF